MNQNVKSNTYIIGVTGLVGVGKSSASEIISSELGASIFNADKVVHKMYNEDISVINSIRKLSEDFIIDDTVNVEALSISMIQNYSLWSQIESIVHSKICILLDSFIENHIKKKLNILCWTSLFYIKYRQTSFAT